MDWLIDWLITIVWHEFAFSFQVFPLFCSAIAAKDAVVGAAVAAKDLALEGAAAVGGAAIAAKDMAVHAAQVTADAVVNTAHAASDAVVHAGHVVADTASNTVHGEFEFNFFAFLSFVIYKFT